MRWRFLASLEESSSSPWWLRPLVTATISGSDLLVVFGFLPVEVGGGRFGLLSCWVVLLDLGLF